MRRRHRAAVSPGRRPAPNGAEEGRAEEGRAEEGRAEEGCAEEGCASEPLFNLPGEGKGLYCRKHAKEGMVDIEMERAVNEGHTRVIAERGHPHLQQLRAALRVVD